MWNYRIINRIDRVTAQILNCFLTTGTLDSYNLFFSLHMYILYMNIYIYYIWIYILYMNIYIRKRKNIKNILAWCLHAFFLLQLSVRNSFNNFFCIVQSMKRNKLKSSTLYNKYKRYKTCWNIVFTMRLTVLIISYNILYK